MFDRYVERLERGLSEIGFAGQLNIMTSSGASIVPETARRFPVRALESGPAAGALMSAHHGRSLALPDLLSFDMGGTTAKGALIRRFAPLKQYDLEVGRVHEFKRGSGLPAKLPVIDMIEIGSGGGSLARVDERGLIRVGPRSAGADPGPACYGKGGTGATLTDANVVLGYLDPGFFLGGEMRLDSDAARAAIERHVAEPRRARSDSRRLGRARDRERGRGPGVPDPRVRARIRLSRLVHGRVRRIGARARARDRPQAPDPARRLSDRGGGHVRARAARESARLRGLRVRGERSWPISTRRNSRECSPPSSTRQRGSSATPASRSRPSSCRLDMRYQGQGYEIEVIVPGDGTRGGYAAAFPRLGELFRAQYAEIFAETFLDEPLEIVSWKVEATGSEAPLAYHGMRGGERGREKRSRPAWFGDAFVDCEVVDRYGLEVGTTIEGPAVVEERESTCVLGPGDRAIVDRAAQPGGGAGEPRR